MTDKKRLENIRERNEKSCCNEIDICFLIDLIEKQDKMIDLMSLAIINYDDQLVINKYRDIEEVKKTFKELVEND